MKLAALANGQNSSHAQENIETQSVILTTTTQQEQNPAPKKPTIPPITEKKLEKNPDLFITKITSQNHKFNARSMILIDDKYKAIIDMLASVSKCPKNIIINNILYELFEENGSLTKIDKINDYTVQQYQKFLKKK